jgi:hypothetical protein
MIRTLLVMNDASFVSFQTYSWDAAIARTLQRADDGYPIARVFMHDDSDPSLQLEEHTIKSLRADVRPLSGFQVGDRVIVKASAGDPEDIRTVVAVNNDDLHDGWGPSVRLNAAWDRHDTWRSIDIERA